MTLYQVIEQKRGRETVKLIDSLPKCNARLKELRRSYRGNVKFRLEKAHEAEKFEAKRTAGRGK